MAEALTGPATLAVLQPEQLRELHYRDYKNRLRLHGSQYMTLKRPSRLAEFGREYVAGDPVNLIDWKAFARTDQLIIREVRDEATARILIGVDLSPTMQWPNAEVPVPAVATKAEVALRVAMHLAYGHLRMGDNVEVWMLESAEAPLPTRAFIPRRPSEVKNAFNHMLSSGFAIAACLACGEDHRLDGRRRDAAFWLGDGLGSADLEAFFAHAQRSFFLHVLSSLELDINWLADGTSYFDQGAVLKEYLGQALKQRSLYQQQLTVWCQGLAERQRQSGGDYLTLSETMPIAAFQLALAGFIKAAIKA